MNLNKLFRLYLTLILWLLLAPLRCLPFVYWGVRRLIGLLFIIRRDALPCRGCGASVSLLGRWQCGSCGFVYDGLAFSRCPNCRATVPYLPCQRCGCGIRNPIG